MDLPIRARIRRWYVANAIYFVTCVTRERRPIFTNPSDLGLLRETVRKAKDHHPFHMLAYAFMPDHFHLLVCLGETTDISKLMHSVQRNFTLNYKAAHNLTGELHIWQRGFWDHVIRDERDLEQHFNYIHYNPVKHGYVSVPIDYPDTSFPGYVERGWYGSTWSEDTGLQYEYCEPREARGE